MIVLMFIIGTIFGSFFLVIGTRLPLNENVITGRSRCDSCKTELKWYELIPVISFLIQKGKCRHCHKKISREHLTLELITGFLFVFGYCYYGICYELFMYLLLVSSAITIFISDFKYMIILDSSWAIASVLIIGLKLFAYGPYSAITSFLSGLFLFIVMNMIKLIGNFLFKKESLGGGDIKLSFLIGTSIGFRLGLIALIFASFLALPYAYAQIHLNKKNELPYGPFLIGSTVIIFIFLEKFSKLLVFFTLS